MQTVSLPDSALTSYLVGYCEKIQVLDQAIRFAGIADYAGKLLASAYRPGLVPLMNKSETEQYALQTVFRARTRGGFKPQLGELGYAVAAYEKLVRATVTVAHPEVEHHNMYLLISLDIGSDYPKILEQKVMPHLSKYKDDLFVRTRTVSEKYAD
jgi:hypothetical protein